MVEIWLKEDWQKRSEKAAKNRTTNPDYMPYTGGSYSVAATHQRMNEEAGHEVGLCEVYKKTHSLAKTNDWTHSKGGCFIADYNELQRNAMEAVSIEINDQVHSSNGSHTLPDNLELWVKATEGKKKGRVLGTKASDPMPLPSNPNMVTSQNTTSDILEIQRQKNKEVFDLSVQEVIRKQMPDIVKEIRKAYVERRLRRMENI